jgi:hypothetical protein
MEVCVTYRDGVQFQAESRGHRILSDQPLELVFMPSNIWKLGSWIPVD